MTSPTTPYAPQPIIDVLEAHLDSLNPRGASVDFFREEEGGQNLVAALEWAAVDGHWALVVRTEAGPQLQRRPLKQLSPEQQRAALGAFFALMMLAAREATSEQTPAVAEALATVAQAAGDSSDARRAFFG